MSEQASRQAWLLASGAILISAALLVWGRDHAASTGARLPLSITVIPQDAVNLDCSSDACFSGTRCNYDSHGRLRDDHQASLRPYVSTSRELFLLAGVFEQTDVQQWLTRARRTGNFARVTLNCQATLLGKLDTVAVRWQVGAAFANESNVPVARVSDCRVAR